MNSLYKTYIQTPLGEMIALADKQFLYFLDFTDNQYLDAKIENIKRYTDSGIATGNSKPLELIKKEIELYFAKKLKQFTTPISLSGTSFQNKVWQTLQKIPYGTTTSYSDIAVSIGKNQAQRAIGNANGHNNLLIIIPCHRIIQTSGSLGGYNAGIERKEWLLKHEEVL